MKQKTRSKSNIRSLLLPLLMLLTIAVTASCGGGGGGAGTPDITVTDSVLPDNDLQVPFGNVVMGVNSDRTVTVTNNGAADLVIGAIASVNPLAAPFSIPTDNCSNHTIAPAGSCTLTVRFSPTAEVTSNDSFDIPSNDPDENPVTVSVSGRGSPPPNIAVSPSNIAFGNVTCGTTPSRTLTISNTDVGSLNITDITITDGFPLFSILSETCPASLSSGSSCNVVVELYAFSEGVNTGTLTIESNDPDTPTKTVGLSATVGICP